MKNIKKLLIAAVLVIIAAVITVTVLKRQDEKPVSTPDPKAQVRENIRKIVNKRHGKRPPKSATTANKSKARRENSDPKLSPRDRKLVDAVQSALDAEDFAAVQTAAENALKSANADVRRDALEPSLGSANKPSPNSPL